MKLTHGRLIRFVPADWGKGDLEAKNDHRCERAPEDRHPYRERLGTFEPRTRRGIMRRRLVVMGVVVLAALVGATLRLGAADSEPTICILQHPPFAPLKTRLFMPQIYPDSPPPEPAPARPVNEAQLRSLVQSTLNTRFQGDQQRVAEGLSVFDSPQIAAIIPDPRLGAGLALLLGTAGGGAIEAIEGEVFESVEFAVPPATDHAYGQVV